MASQKYFCYKCRDNGFPQEEVIFSGKDAEGKTILKDPTTGLLHQHKHKEQQSKPQPKMSGNQTEQASSSFHVSDESVDRGISAFSMMTDLIRLVEQTQKLLVSMDGKIDHLTKLVYALSEQQQQQHDQNPHTLFDNR